MIHFHKISKRYENGKDALLNISFELDQGEITFLTGHSGAGKSTLLKLIMLIERATAGKLEVCGQDVAKVGRSAIPYYRRQIGMVFQNHQLLFDRTVYDNVALPLIIAGMSYREAGRRVRPALEQVGLLHKEKQNPETLSAGEQQRVGIARAIVTRPKLLIADEPTGNLDPDTTHAVLDLLLAEVERVGATLLMVTHDHGLLPRFGRTLELQGLGG